MLCSLGWGAGSVVGQSLTVASTSLTLEEGEGGRTTSTYRVRLAVVPTDTVKVTSKSSDTLVVTVSAALTFTRDNWSTDQTVTVTVVKRRGLR